MAGFKLQAVNGNGGAIEDVLPLEGLMPADGLFLVVNVKASDGLKALADQVGKADYQNGPDSVQLLWGETLVDALGYGKFDAAVFGGEGSPAPDVKEGHSLCRDAAFSDTDDNAADFKDCATPTPGAVNQP
jgi:hypothetical protein